MAGDPICHIAGGESAAGRGRSGRIDTRVRAIKTAGTRSKAAKGWAEQATAAFVEGEDPTGARMGRWTSFRKAPPTPRHNRCGAGQTAANPQITRSLPPPPPSREVGTD